MSRLSPRLLFLLLIHAFTLLAAPSFTTASSFSSLSSSSSSSASLPSKSAHLSSISLSSKRNVALSASVSPTTSSSSSSSSSTTTSQPTTAVACTIHYTVVSGDNCFSIATSNGISLSEFFVLNPMISTNCTTLLIGQVVCIAGPATITSSPTTSPADVTTAVLFQPAVAFFQVISSVMLPATSTLTSVFTITLPIVYSCAVASSITIDLLRTSDFTKWANGNVIVEPALNGVIDIIVYFGFTEAVISKGNLNMPPLDVNYLFSVWMINTTAFNNGTNLFAWQIAQSQQTMSVSLVAALSTTATPTSAVINSSTGNTSTFASNLPLFIGVIVGVIVLIILVLVGVVLCRRWQQHRTKTMTTSQFIKNQTRADRI